MFLDRTVFRPADRWTREVSSGAGGVFPAGEGLFSPLHAVVSARVGRELAALGEEIRERDRKLRQFELLRRELEETQSNLEAKIQDLRSIYEVSTAIAGTLDIEELFRIIPERVMNALGLNDFCVFLYHPESGNLVCRASAGMPSSV
ncbi:MAG TPA: hypothetical protein VJ386_04280, partial [Candidatus Deferrimicrobiaceae bacterium]|nr:hypothetical protein [Candidatus Deferrimicrobiaceae bacterium]